MNIKNRRKNLKGLIILTTAVICILLGSNYVSAIYEDIEFYETYKPLVFNIDDSNTLETRRIYDIQNTQIPSSFNLKNKIRIETADQKNLELSNLFASVKSIETNYQLKTGKYIDLSERYIDYMTSNKLLGDRNSGIIYGDNDDSYGDPVRTGEAILLSSIYGIPLESEVPYRNYADNELSEIENAKPACRVISTVQFPKLDTYRYDNRYEEWINIVKAHIMKYGSLQMMVALDETTMNYSTNAYYCKEGETTINLDHTVSIIGWDDNYPKENFKIQPYHDGAFIVLNSWGENWGDNGVFYVSYDCTKGFENLMGILNTEDCVNESEYTYAECIYDNDDVVQVASAEKNCYAVIYNVKSQDEYLKHIGIMTGTNYERCNIKIYCNPYDGELNEEKYVLVGETRNMYRNWDNAIIDLEEPLKLEGSQFAIILEMEYYENDLLYNVASVTRYLHELISGNFYNSSDLSSNWEQLGYDIPLFAYTVNNGVRKIEVTKRPDRTGYYEHETFDPTGIEVKVTYMDGTTKTVTENDIEVTNGEDLKRGQTTVSISYTENGVTKTVQIPRIVVVKVVGNTTWQNDYEYTLEHDSIITLNKYIGEDTQITVPNVAIIDDKVYTVKLKEIESDEEESIWGSTNIESIAFEAGIILPDNLTNMFKDCLHLTNLDVHTFNTKNVHLMECMFAGCENLTKLDLSGFNTENVESMYCMFYGCKSLNDLNISSFNTSKVTNMESMFENCECLESLDLRHFNTSKVDDMGLMFCECKSLRNLKINNFNTDSLAYTGYMFKGCINIRDLDLSNFNTSNVGSMEYMFTGCENLNSIDISNFSFDSIEEYTDMFASDNALKIIIVPKNIPQDVQIELPFSDYYELKANGSYGGTAYNKLPTGLTQITTIKRYSEEAVSLNEIFVTKNPTKMKYVEGEEIDLAGIEVTAEYIGGIPKIITAGQLVVVAPGTLVEGQEEVRISYTENGVTKYATITGLTVTKGTIPQEKVLNKISVIKNPNKMGYQEGEEIDLTGIEVMVEYIGGEPKTITSEQLEVVTTGALMEGQEEVRISYTEKGVTKYATITGLTVSKEKVLCKISVTKNPSKMTYVEGEEIDLAGIEVKAEYTSGNPVTLNAGQLELVTEGLLEEGQEEVKISYTENGVTKYATITGLTVTKETVQNKVLDNISIIKNPNKMGYQEGEEIDLAGIEVKAEYTNGTPRIITEERIQVATPGTLVEGQKEIRISYTENGVTKYATITGLTVTREKELYRISIIKNPSKMEYLEGEEIDLTGIEVKAEYTSGDPKVVAKEQIRVESTEVLVAGQEEVRISYTENGVTKYATITGLTVTKETLPGRVLNNISIIKDPNKMGYLAGETVDLTGIEVRVEYTNDNPRTVTAEKIAIASAGTLVAGQEEVRISYTENGVTKYATITGLTVTGGTVQEKVLYRISIIKNPSKMGYLEGETINLTGIEVKAEYTNGESTTITSEGIEVVTAGTLVAGQEEVRISYTENGVTKYATITGLTVTKETTPQEKILYRISITKNPNKMEYKEGEEIDLSGIEVKAEYTSGSPVTLNANQVEVVTAGTLVAGQEEVRISYTENGVTKYATITGLTVTKETTQEKVLSRISITKNPSKMGYLEDETIDLTGIEVKAEYINGEPKTITSGQLVVVTPGTLVAGQQEVRISYTENGVTKYATITGLTVTQVRTLYRISITKNPTKMEYVEGEEIDLSGIEVKAEYTSGSSVTLNASQVEVATPGALMEGQEEIRIRYKENGVTKYATITGLTVTQEVTIEKTLYRIDIIKNPTKMEYKEGETINLSGIEVRAEYINGSPRTITSEQLEVVTPGTLVAGQEEVRISYTEDGVTKYATITGLTVTKETIGGQDLSVAFKTYSPVTKNGIVYVKGIVPETSFRDVEDDITTNGDKIELYKGTEKITNKDTKITTGMILTISLNSQEKSYTLVVIGDLTGDGKLNGKDLLKLARYKAGLDKNLTGAYLEAADIHMDNECAGNKDLLKMARIMAHKDSL